jgi:hypothetical protein
MMAVMAALLAILGAQTLPAADAPVEPTAEIDVVAKSGLRMAPGHTQAFDEAMRRNAEQCLAGVVDTSGKVDPPDGAARYRLQIQYAGTIAMGNATSSEPVLDDKDYVGIFLKSQEKGAYKYTLLKWAGTKYTTVESWGSNVARLHYYPLPERVNNREVVAYREKALMEIMPIDEGPGLLSRLLPIRLAGETGVPGGEKAITVTVQNKSMWPLKQLSCTLEWPDSRARGRYRYRGDVVYNGLLMPGEQTTLKGKGMMTPARFKWEFEQPMSIDAHPVWDADRGPSWVERLVESMKGKAADERSAAVAALGSAAPPLVASETAVAGPGLVALFAAEDPKGPDAVPADIVGLLVRLDKAAVPALIDGVKDADTGVRLGSVVTLGRMKLVDRAALTRLRDALRDKAPVVADAARAALEANGQTVPAN